MKRKKLLYIGNALSTNGATVTNIETLGTLLIQEGYDVTISSRKRNKIVRMMDMAYVVLKNRNPVDLVLIDTYSTKNFWYAVSIAFICRRCNLPYIPILHGGNLPKRLKQNKLVSNQLFGKATVNVAPSNYLYSAFAKAGFSNVVQIPNTIEVAHYPFKKRSELSPKLLWVRAFSEIYNPMMALEVFALVRKHYPKVRLTMVGPDKDGSLKTCEDIAEKQKLEITFTGKLDKNDWIALSQDFDIFINTTNIDNVPVSVIEAMALGLPIVSTNVGGIPFLIENKIDGLLSDPRDPKQFAQNICDLLNNNDLAGRLSYNGRIKSEQYDWSSVKQLWHNLLY